MPEKNEKQLESMESVRWVDRYRRTMEEKICGQMGVEPGVEGKRSDGW